MKKSIIILLLCASTFNVFSQLKISSNNKIGVGTEPDNNYAVTMTGDVFIKGSNNTYIRLLASSGSGGPFVDISPSSNQVGYSYLGYYNQWYSTYLKYLYVYNNLTLFGSFYNYSDKSVKKDINQLSFDKDRFNQLKPVSYNMVDSLELNKKNGKKETLKFEKKEHPIKGFLAQDVQKIYPELVEEDGETGLLKIKPLEFIPILVKAIQTQQGEIDNLKKEIANFSSNPSKIKLSNTNNSLGEALPAMLYQNNPNPVSQPTQIKYYLPSTVQNAYLCIYDLQGKQLKQIAISGRGNGSQLIKASEFVAGIYLYGLIADDNEVDTKRMTLTN